MRWTNRVKPRSRWRCRQPVLCYRIDRRSFTIYRGYVSLEGNTLKAPVTVPRLEMYHCGLLLVLFYRSLGVVGGVSQSEIDRHLELGREFLAKGQLSDALTHYHAAVDGDPNNYLTYYKRGAVHLALGKAKVALSDLNKVLELKPDFTAARLQRGNVLLKQAEFDLAERDSRMVLAVDPNNKDALELVSKIEPNRNALHIVESLVHGGKYGEAADLITPMIEVSPWSPHLRELRAKVHVAAGDYINAISDIRLTTKLLSDNTDGFFKLSTLLYRLGNVDDSLKEIRECLKLDPDHKECFPFYKKVKKVVKWLKDANAAEESRDTERCVANARQLLTYETELDNVRFLAHHLLCKCYLNDVDPSLAVSSCQDALNIHREFAILCDSAEANLAAEMYDDAIRDVKDALEIDPNSEKAKELLQKAQQRQKISESRDYYKILGVPRTASKRDVIKAYRKAAQQWHPDNFQNINEKKRAEKKFLDIAAAKEVLTDEEKRAKFDQGEDPLDPESGRHVNPFHESHHFHGSPFQFKFHFN